MRLPRDLGGEEFARKLGSLGYEVTRQSGSHIRLTRSSPEGEHHITIPSHKPLRVGTLNSILNDVAEHLDVSKAEVLRQIA